MGAAAKVEGDVEQGYGPVADEFRAAFERHGELGAAFAAYVGPRKVVDLWGGVADRGSGELWKENTLQLVFSGTKGLTAGCMLSLLEAGLLELDRPVGSYWPEFASAGKDEITVRDVVSHQAGLPAITTPLTSAGVVDGVRMAGLLAAQAPRWPEGRRLAYHALTYGWLCDALARRVCGESIGELFSRRIAKPLEIEAWIGLPPEHEGRVSVLELDEPLVAEPLRDPEYGRLIYGNPPLLEDTRWWNTPACHVAEMPAANGIASARALAKYYSCLANRGALDGVRILSPDSVVLGRRELSRDDDAYFGEPMAFGVGFELQTELKVLGPFDDAFGHCGAGGSTHGGWPDTGVGFSYCMNLMRDNTTDERGRRLLTTLARSMSIL